MLYQESGVHGPISTRRERSRGDNLESLKHLRGRLVSPPTQHLGNSVATLQIFTYDTRRWEPVQANAYAASAKQKQQHQQQQQRSQLGAAWSLR
jgi:hypothetical protein